MDFLVKLFWDTTKHEINEILEYERELEEMHHKLKLTIEKLMGYPLLLGTKCKILKNVNDKDDLHSPLTLVNFVGSMLPHPLNREDIRYVLRPAL